METELQVTSIEQSKRLIEAGIPTTTASIVYICNDTDSQLVKDQRWTIGDLIDLLPNCIYKGKIPACLIINKNSIFYTYYDPMDDDEMCLKKYSKHKNLIDNLVDAVIDTYKKENNKFNN